MKKIYITLLLVVASILTISAQEQFTVGQLTYEPVTVDGIDGWKVVEPAVAITGELVIPREVTYGGVTKPVLVIGTCAFSEDDNNSALNYRGERAKGITTLTFEAGSMLRIIEDYAFAAYENHLSGTITIPSTVTSIGNAVFYPEEPLDVIRFEYGSKIQELNLRQFSYVLSQKIYLPKSVSQGFFSTNTTVAWYIDNVYVEWEDNISAHAPYYDARSFDAKDSQKNLIVPIGTKSSYEASNWKTRHGFNVTEISLAEHKSVQETYIDDLVRRATWGAEPSAELSAIIASAKATIDNATSASAASSAVESFRINLLVQRKKETTEQIKSLMAGVENKFLIQIAGEAIKMIPLINDFDAINHYYEDCVPQLTAAMELYNLSHTPTASGAGMRLKITKQDDTVWEFKLTDNMVLDTEVFGTPSESEVNAFALKFNGSGNPIETQHLLADNSIVFCDNGNQMLLNVNNASATYDMSSVSALALFCGTPSVELHASQDPNSEVPSYYTTFYSGLEAYTLPEGVRAYTGEVDGDCINFTSIEGNVIPQGEAVLLYSEENEVILMEAIVSDAQKNADNQLHGEDIQSDQQPDSKYFMLSSDQDNLGFCLIDHSVSLPANTAFITMPTDVQTAFLRIKLSDKEDICNDIHRYVVEKDKDGNAVWIWDGVTKAMLQLVCARNSAHRSQVVASGDAITNVITTEMTCVADGVRTYTATLIYNDVKYTSTTTEPVIASGHEYILGICQHCGDSPSHFDEFTINDGDSYILSHECTVDLLTYNRYYPVELWSAWLAPFDVNASILLANGLTPAYVEGIHNYDDDEDGIIDRTVMEIVKISNGRLPAGTPLLVRAAEGYSSQLELSDVTMKANDDLNNIHTETATMKFDFIGTYTNFTATAENNIFSLSTKTGDMARRIGKILPLRWYCQVEQKPSFIGDETSAPALVNSIRISVIGEEDMTTGIRTLYNDSNQPLESTVRIFDLYGRQFSAPQRGKINIINGKKQLVK